MKEKAVLRLELYSILKKIISPAQDTGTTTTTYQDPYETIVTPINRTTPIGYNPVPYAGTGPDLAFWGTLILFALVFIFGAIYYYRNMIKEELRRINVRHFNLDQFLIDTETTDLSEYNRKYGLIIVIGFVGMLIVPSISMSLIPDSLDWVRGIITVFGYLVLIMFLWNFISEMTNREIREMHNAVWMSTELYIAGRGSYSKTFKGIIPEKLIVLSDQQLNQLANEIIRTARNFGHKFKRGEASKQKKIIIERLRKLYVYRVSVKGKGEQIYKLLMVFNNKWKDLVNPNQEELFHKTTEVKVTRAPVHTVYIGESNRIFRELDDKGRPKMNQVIMGVFVGIIDRMAVQKKILEGRFDAMNAQDALISQMLNYFEQESTTSEFVNGKINALNKRDKEYDDLKNTKESESQAAFNTYMRAFNRLFMKHQQKGVMANAFFWVIVCFFLYYALFTMFGWMG